MATPTITFTTSTPLDMNFHKISANKLCTFKKRTQNTRLLSTCTKVSCNSTRNYDNDNKCSTNDKSRLLLDRRNMLIGLGGMYGAALTLEGETLAAPIAPDVTACTLTDAQWDGSVGDHCCPPKFDPNAIVDFKFENYPTIVTKVRRPAHKAMKDPEFVKDYKNAVAVMRSLPMSDPRSFWQQARVHCAYCDGAYPVLGYPNDRLEVHASWLFAAFHRYEVFFFERILAKLIDKPSLAVPYWNWDHPDGMKIPDMFKEVASPLYDPNRNLRHLDKIVDLSYNLGSENDYPDQKQILENLLLMRKQMLYQTKPSLFFGEKYVAGDINNPNVGAGALEFSPHNNVHAWTGSTVISGYQDMGAFWSSARDPVFYSHHSNVDRMWYIWRNELPGRSRVDITDPDYLNAYFIFYDENAKPVRCYIRDSFDMEKFGYRYEPQDLPWLSNKTTPPLTRPLVTDKKETFPQQLDKVIKTRLERPKRIRTNEEKEQEEEVLVINIEVGMLKKFIKFDVYVNDNYDHKIGEKTQVKAQFAGSYTSLGHRSSGSRDMKGMPNMASRKNSLRLGITKLLEDIGASEDEAIQVTIVPISGYESIVITDVKINFVA